MNASDFQVRKLYTYSGPNFYLNRPAVVFNLFLEFNGPDADFYRDAVVKQFPVLAHDLPTKVVDLFAATLLQTVKMDLDLYVNNYCVMVDGDEWTIAIEYLDAELTKSCISLVSDWFNALNNSDESFDFQAELAVLQEKFDKTMFGGPTLYSLIEGGVKRGIPVHYLYEENQFQWGYGKKQRRGRSTIFHTDGIKDTEFTTYKDMVGDFLELCGFPTPQGRNCFTEEEILEEAEKLGWPVVIKPVAGHKGQGVTTGIESIPEAKKAFNNILQAAAAAGVAFEGALVQQQIYGFDHRILTIGGKFTACLKREPAFVTGDGQSTIKELIDKDNELDIRADTARSPLAKIKLDEDMLDYLQLQEKTPETIPAMGEKVVLRRVANISAGGVSVNVSDQMHPENIEMAENIAKFLQLTALGIDVLAKDISKPWTEGDFGIIEINAGPGVFMHLAPAFGGSIDVPGKIMEHFFGDDPKKSRIPIITGNYLTSRLIENIYTAVKEIKQDAEFGAVKTSGVYFNNKFFTQQDHDDNCRILLRNPKLDVAVIDHDNENIHDFGTYHWGHDLAILDRPNYAERILERDLLPEGILIEINTAEELHHLQPATAPVQAEGVDASDKDPSGQDPVEETQALKTEMLHEITGDSFDTLFLVVKNAGNVVSFKQVDSEEHIDDKIMEALQPYLKDLLNKYD